MTRSKFWESLIYDMWYLIEDKLKIETFLNLSRTVYPSSSTLLKTIFCQSHSDTAQEITWSLPWFRRIVAGFSPRKRYPSSAEWHWTIFSRSTSVFPCQRHFACAPYSVFHLSPTLYNLTKEQCCWITRLKIPTFFTDSHVTLLTHM